MATAIGKTTISVLLPRPGFVGWVCRLLGLDYGYQWNDISNSARLTSAEFIPLLHFVDDSEMNVAEVRSDNGKR